MRSLRGVAYVNPHLYCDDETQPCRYIPTKSDCSGSRNGQWSDTSLNSGGLGYNVHGGGLNYSFADSSAKFRRIGPPNSTATDPRVDPFGSYSNNLPTSRPWDQFNCHAYLFRPDLDIPNGDPATK